MREKGGQKLNALENIGGPPSPSSPGSNEGRTSTTKRKYTWMTFRAPVSASAQIVS